MVRGWDWNPDLHELWGSWAPNWLPGVPVWNQASNCWDLESWNMTRGSHKQALLGPSVEYTSEQAQKWVLSSLMGQHSEPAL